MSNVFAQESLMDSLKQEREAAHKKRMAEKKERLQKELKEIDEKSAVYKCITCENDYNCMTCGNYRDDSCSCLSGYYDDGSSRSCRKCYDNCQLCTGGSVQECL